MAKCSRCQQRKAKRRCPGLRNDLCPLCCGLLREKEVACPPTCRFLAEHRPYQEKRILEKKQAAPARAGRRQDDFLKDERIAWLALNIEAPLKEIGERNPSFTDAEAILALEYAKEKLAKGRSILLIPGEDRKPGNEVGEAIFQSVENCKYEGNVILTAAAESYKSEEKVRCLDRLILAAKTWARENYAGRAYIDHLREQFAQIAEMSRTSKVITPR